MDTDWTFTGPALVEENERLRRLVERLRRELAASERYRKSSETKLWKLVQLYRLEQRSK